MTAPSGPAPIVVVGDTLLDVDVEGEADRLAPDAPVPVICRHTEHRRPGGAGLAGLLAARDGAPVVLITAIGDDEAGRYLRGLLTEHLELIRLPLRGTTVSKTRVRARGQTLLRIDGGDGHARRRANGAANRPEMEEALALASRALERAGAVLVSDYGRGVAEVMREHLRDLAVPLVWDPHPHGPKPVPECALVTPSEAEARLLCSEPYMTADLAARQLVRALGAEAVAVTLGAGGAALARRGGKSVRVPAPGVAAGSDACGAGDRFAGAAALALRDGEPVEDAVAQAVGEATRFVEAGGAAATRFGETGAHRFGAGRGGTITAAVPSLGDRPRSAEEVAELVHGTGGG
ncbi:bifunctional heptose 7-phosphate kinase/heptose 1-phosphate adenyltransferase [Thermocatellispora tengchongensis]|uniref:bifunctional heptose 7-phosphate kinase/heptose 1-phosphate adenyltransferase n=1 Tax=Thermocatellispora tengchongensis TaxID=1073253 RepID=UPI003629255D